MLKIAVRVLTILAVGHGVTAWAHDFKHGRASQTGQLVSEQVAARTTPLPLCGSPDLITVLIEEN
jgi:hypothetical protein